MCSRYALTSPPEAVRRAFGHVNELTYPPRYNIAPTQPVAIVRLDYAKQREMTLVRWGLIPSWVVCHERSRSKRLCATQREMKEGPSGSAIRS